MIALMSVLHISIVIVWVEYHRSQFVEIHFVGRYLIVSSHDLVSNGLFLVDDVVECTVDGMATDEIVTRHVVLLPNTVRSVFALAAVGISLRKFYESHV